MKKYFDFLDEQFDSGRISRANAAFLRDLAGDLADSGREVKCPLCAYALTCGQPAVFQPCSQGITEYLTARSHAFREQTDLHCKNYFAYLDELQKTGGHDQYTAEAALKVEFLWLASHDAYAKFAMACWMLKRWG